jgi:hypothetical protein
MVPELVSCVLAPLFADFSLKNFSTKSVNDLSPVWLSSSVLNAIVVSPFLSKKFLLFSIDRSTIFKGISISRY